MVDLNAAFSGISNADNLMALKKIVETVSVPIQWARVSGALSGHSRC